MKKLIIISVVFILLFFNAVLFIQNQNLKKKTDNLNKKIINLEEQKLTNKSNTDNWIVYKNNEYNYEFKHPSLNIEDVSKSRCNIEECLSFILTNIPPIDNRNNLWIIVKKFPQNKNIQEYIDDIRKVASINYISKIRIDNLNAYKVSYSSDVSVVSTFIQRNDFLYEITIQNPTDNYSNKVYEMLLSSFKFVNRN